MVDKIHYKYAQHILYRAGDFSGVMYRFKTHKRCRKNGFKHLAPILLLPFINLLKSIIMANQPIPINQANAMMSLYLSYMKSLGAAYQTQYIIFTAKELHAWLTEVLPYADEIRVCEGMNLPAHAQAGSLTVIFWPYKNGEPAVLPGNGNAGDDPRLQPYNDGHVSP